MNKIKPDKERDRKRDRKRRRVSAFGAYLTELRNGAGLSLDMVVAASKNKKGGKISKSALSLYERGETISPSPELLETLAEIYKVPFRQLAEAWFTQRFFPEDKKKTPLTLPGTLQTGKQIRLVLPEEHIEIQKSLEAGSQVAVCAVDFVEERYFELVLGNLKRGIKYHHLVPEECRSEYQAFVSKLEAADRTLKGKIDRQLLFFTPRTDLDFPVSYVLYLHKNSEIEGFIALPLGSAPGAGPQCYERTSEALSWKLYLSFHWSLALSRESKLRKTLSGLYLDVREKIRWQKSPLLID